jgi:protein arginine kinase activator
MMEPDDPSPVSPMSHPTCELCHKNVATVTVIEIPPLDATSAGPAGELPHEELHLCEICAQARNLPHAPVGKKMTMGDIWKLLQVSGAQAQAQAPKEETCPECGMTLGELRSRGRIGCARDYEVFGSEIQNLLERIHGATDHVGRTPGQSPEELEQARKNRRVEDLRRRFESAVRDEEYERAARIRDELEALGERA